MSDAKCIRCGSGNAGTSGYGDMDGKPSCAICFNIYASAVRYEDSRSTKFYQWAAANPVTPAPAPQPAGAVDPNLVAANEWRFTCAACGVRNRTESAHIGHGCPDKASTPLPNGSAEERGKLMGERDRLRAQLAEVTGAKLRVGDLLGERDALRNRVHELETALSFAERELSRTRGRK